MSAFEKLTNRDASNLTDPSGRRVFHVKTPHALTQAVGYLKFNAQPFERIYIRGQSQLYPKLSPSLYRGISSVSAQGSRHSKMNAAIKIFKDSCQIFKKFPDHAHEPLLQHYGIKTTWIDIVDNIWVALWFSVFESFSAGENNEFVHLDMRKPSVDSPFGYLLLLVVSENRRLTPIKGMVKGTNTEVVDLRVAAPSVFLRPHAQHGLLLRVKGTNTGRELDYFSAVRGIIRYDLEDAIDWLVF